MNNNSVKLFYHLHVLIPPIPFLLQAKEGGVKFFAPLCDAERGWSEFMRLYI